MCSRYLNVAMLLGVVGLAACATTQQLVIKADMAYATAVFALDDAEYAECHPPVSLSVDTCNQLDAKIGQALVDVKRVTLAVQKTPGALPVDLPSLLTDLNNIQGILVALPHMPIVTTLATKTADANAKAIALLTKIGGK